MMGIENFPFELNKSQRKLKENDKYCFMNKQIKFQQIIFSIILKMKYKHSIQIKLARALGRSILSMDLNPMIYFIVLGICYMQTVRTFITNKAALFQIVKWFDPFLFINPTILMYVLVSFLIMIACSILAQIVWVFNDNCIQTTVVKYYIIKISTTLAYIISYTLTLPIIQSSIALISSDINFNKAIGIASILIFLFIIYPYSMLLLTDLSPENEKIFSLVYFPNCFTFLNVYRPIVSIIVATTYHTSLILVLTVIFCVFLIFFIIKYPSISWRCNELTIAYFSSYIWTILYHIVELATSSHTTIWYFIIVFPFFIFFMAWAVHKRVFWVLTMEKNSMIKLKTIYHLLINMEMHQQQLYVFIVNHYKICPESKCPCNKLVSQLHNSKKLNEKNGKILDEKSRKKLMLSIRFSLTSVINAFKSRNKQRSSELKPQRKNNLDENTNCNELKTNEKKIWFQLLYEIQSSQFTKDKLKELTGTEKVHQFRKARQVILDEVEILRSYLDQQYQSLRNLWYSKQIHEETISCLFFYVRFCLEESRQQKTIKVKSTGIYSNQYAVKFYELQVKLLNFREHLLSAVTMYDKFWTQLTSEKPDQKIIISLIKNLQLVHLDISNSLKSQKCNEISAHLNSEFELSWKQKSKIIMQELYQSFESVTKLNSNNRKMMCTSLTHLKNKQQVTLEKNLTFYDYNSKTGMGIVNIEEGDLFGSISLTNKEFWTILHHPRYDKAKINHFLVKEIHEYHNRIMINFLHQNKHFLNFHRGFAIDGMKLLIQIQFSVVILPLFYEGLHAAVFLQEINPHKAVFVITKSSNVLAFSNKFKQKFLQNISFQEFNEIINKKVVENLQNNGTTIIQIEEIQYVINSIHRIENVDLELNLLFCEIIFEKKEINVSISQEIIVSGKTEAPTDFVNVNQPSLEKPKNNQSEIQFLLNILNGDKKNRNLGKWKIFVTVALLGICITAILCLVFSQAKVRIYNNGNYMITTLSNYIQDLTWNTFVARKINILQFTNNTLDIDMQLSTFNTLHGNLLSYRSILNVGLWSCMLNAFDTSVQGSITITNTTYDMIIQKYIQSSTTTILSDPYNQNYDYVLSQIVFPYDVNFINFIGLIRNTFYGILNVTSIKFRQYIQEQFLNKVISWNTKLIIITSIISLFLCLLIFIGTLYCQFKLLYFFRVSLSFLQKIQLFQIEERIQSFNQYKKENLSDLQKPKKEKIRNSLKISLTSKKEQSQFFQSQSKRVKTPSRLKQTTKTERMLHIFHDLSTMSREETIQVEDIKIEFQKKDKKKVKIKKRISLSMALKVIIGLIPLIIICLTILIIQVYYNSTIFEMFSLKELYHQKLEVLRMVKTYTYEIGYEIDRLKQQNYSISQQLPNIVNHLYHTIRKIESQQNYYFKSVSQQISYFKSITLCQIQIILDTLGYSSCLCDYNQTMRYGSKSWDQVIEDYSSTAKSMGSLYKNSMNTSQQRSFMMDPTHYELERYSLQLINIEFYIIKVFDDNLKKYITSYEVLIIVLCVTLIGIILVTYQKWLKKQMKKMESEVNQIKTLIRIIASVDLNKNQQLKKEILANGIGFKKLI